MQYFGQRSGVVSTIALVSVFVAGAAWAQTLRNANPPAELPPAGYTANQYIDSRGCAFVRAGIGGQTSWVPRVSRNREQMCGFQPTNQQVAVPAALPTSAQAPAPSPVVAASPLPAAPVVSATTRPTARVETATVAPAFTHVAAAPSPRVIIAPEPISQAPAPRQITRAEACEGRTGVQPNMISSRTGQPIDCGGATLQQVAVNGQTQQRRLTRAAACADAATSGRRYVSARTGQPLQCDGTTATSATFFDRLFANLLYPQQRYSNPLNAAPGSTLVRTSPDGTVVTTGSRYSNVLDNAPGSTNAPSSYSRVAIAQPAAPVTVTRAQRSPAQSNAMGDLLGTNSPPYSNPTHAYALPTPTVPDGYERVWDDGRLNPRRGLPTHSSNTNVLPANDTVTYATAPREQAQQPRVSTRVAQPQLRSEQISGNRYVQVGTFASRDQAQQVARSLRSQGLAMRVGVFTQNGQEMRIVLAGPFGSDSQLQNALGTVRGAGFSGAFTRQ